MLPDISREESWSFIELKKHHKEHHEREDVLLKLLKRCSKTLFAIETHVTEIDRFDSSLLDDLHKELGNA